MPGPVSNVKKPAGVKRGKPRKRNENVRKPRAASVSRPSHQAIPAPLGTDPVQEAYDYAKGVCDRLRPLVKA